MCVSEIERESECICDREMVCVYRDSVCVFENKEKESECVHVCVSVCVCV